MTDYDNAEPAEALEAPAEASAPSSEHTFFLPPECVEALQGEGVSLEPGSTIPLKVVGKDKDGNIEVGYAKEESDDWGKDLENSMPASVGGNMQEPS